MASIWYVRCLRLSRFRSRWTATSSFRLSAVASTVVGYRIVEFHSVHRSGSLCVELVGAPGGRSMKASLGRGLKLYEYRGFDIFDFIVVFPWGSSTSIVFLCTHQGYDPFPFGGTAAASQYGRRKVRRAFFIRVLKSPSCTSLNTS
jgi:hypothetical protein